MAMNMVGTRAQAITGTHSSGFLSAKMFASLLVGLKSIFPSFPRLPSNAKAASLRDVSTLTVGMQGGSQSHLKNGITPLNFNGHARANAVIMVKGLAEDLCNL